MANKDYFIEVDYSQRLKSGEVVCGDRFLSKRIKSEDRIIIVLSDGLGSGVKANVLATLTASMGINFIYNLRNIKKITEIICSTLPVCSERKMSYATFTLLQIEDGKYVKMVEYDNPPAIITVGNEFEEIRRLDIEFTHPLLGKRIVKYSEFELSLGKRIIFFTDGVVQAGMESRSLPFGWGLKELKKYVKKVIGENGNISSRELSNEIVLKALANDNFKAKDDITCGVLYYRKPQKLLIITGPPYNSEKDKYIAYRVDNYAGKGKILICGGTTANIIARELNRTIKVDMGSIGWDIPPVSYMDGVDLVTEGIITLSKVCKILEEREISFFSKNLDKRNPLSKILHIILESDIVEFIVGTRINEAHQNPELPIELEIRRNIVKRIRDILEEKFLKEVSIEYV